MAKIKYDVTDVEPGQDFDIPVPKGAYRCRISDCSEGPSKASIERGDPQDMLTMEYEILHGESKGRKLWDYIVLTDEQMWKLRQVTDALGKRTKGTLDSDAIIGEKVLVKVRHQSEPDPEDEKKTIVRSRVGTVMPLPDTDEEEEVEESEEEGTDEEYTYDEIMSAKITALKKIIAEEELDVRVTKTSKLATIREKVVEALELEEEPEEEEEEEEEPEEGEEDELTYEDLQEYDRDDLEALIDEEELDVKFNKRTSDDVLMQRVAEELELEDDSEEAEEEEEGEEEEAEDYGDMSIADLRTELKSRGLPTKGPKSKLVKRLEEDDNNGDEPF